MRRGDIIMVELPKPSSQQQGREQLGRRPAIIIQDETKFSSLPTILVVPLTSNQNAKRFPGTFLVRPTPTNGLGTDSVILAFQARAVDRNRIDRLMGKLDPGDQERLDALLKELFCLL